MLRRPRKSSKTGDHSSRADDQSAVERAERAEDRSKSRLVTFLQGATVFVVMFVTLYATLRWLLPEEETQGE